ncbi:MAG: glutaredoxin 3 [Rickettsiaceae bacterium]|nr:glutaredoxin 3 [Rickettsiaceae bacterium]
MGTQKSKQENNIKIDIYTTSSCPYCDRAKMLLKNKKAPFNELNAEDVDIRGEMVQRSGGKKSVPQIFINDEHIGGCDDLYALDREGKLDQKLGLN